jgi:hypothetical protein
MIMESSYFPIFRKPLSSLGVAFLQYQLYYYSFPGKHGAIGRGNFPGQKIWSLPASCLLQYIFTYCQYSL